MSPMRPRLPARYGQLELIARGGMADVYRATDAALARPVAVKVLAERYARADEFRLRFTREAQTAARLSGEPNVIVIYDVGEARGLPYIVMEYAAGGSVADRLRAGPLPPAQALVWLHEAAAALDAAHARGVVHRDVKPANLLVNADGELRVTDFGIARAAGHDTLTGTGTILGTSGYMAPEQAQGLRATDASDRYALGCVAFELLTGRRPFAGESVTAEATAHATAPIPSASALEPTLPSGVDAVFRRALAKAPAERHGTCLELARDLQTAFRDAVTETRRVAPVTTTAPPDRLATANAASRYGVRRRRRGLVLGAGVLALAAAGFAVAWVGTGPDPSVAVVTEVRTRTVTGATQLETVTVEKAPSERSQPSSPRSLSGLEANDQGFTLMQEGDFDRALPLLERAVASLRGTGQVAEGWASYNLAFTRLALGRCDGVIDLLDRSEAVQGERKEIDRLRRQAEKACSADHGSGHREKD